MLDDFLRDPVEHETLSNEALNGEVKPRGAQPGDVAELLRLTEKLMRFIEPGALVLPSSITAIELIDVVRNEEQEAALREASSPTSGVGKCPLRL